MKDTNTMTTTMLKFALGGLLVTAITGMPLQTRAQAAPPEKKEVLPHATPFHGKLKAVDQEAKTIAVGDRTFHVPGDIKILKSGKPAALSDGVVGEEVSGAFKKGEDGKLTATTLRFGPK